VRFSSVVIYEHPMIAGVEPVSSGAPVTLGWKPVNITRTTLAKIKVRQLREKFQRMKESADSASSSSILSATRCEGDGLVRLSSKRRYEILLNAGVAHEEIAQASRVARMCRQERLETKLKLQMHQLRSHLNRLQLRLDDSAFHDLPTSSPTEFAAFGSKLVAAEESASRSQSKS